MLKLFFTLILTNFVARLFFYWLTQRAAYEWSDLWTVALLSVPAVFLAFILVEFMDFMASALCDRLVDRYHLYRQTTRQRLRYTTFRERVKLGLFSKDSHFEEQAKRKVIK